MQLYSSSIYAVITFRMLLKLLKLWGSWAMYEIRCGFIRGQIMKAKLYILVGHVFEPSSICMKFHKCNQLFYYVERPVWMNEYWDLVDNWMKLTKGPPIYYVSKGLGEWVQKMASFCWCRWVDGSEKVPKMCWRNIWMVSK